MKYIVDSAQDLKPYNVLGRKKDREELQNERTSLASGREKRGRRGLMNVKRRGNRK